MPEDLFAVMARIPIFADSLERCKSPEETDDEALEYVRLTYPFAEPEDLRAPAADILRVRRDEKTCAECDGKRKCPLGYHPLVLREEKFRGKTAYIVRAGDCGSRNVSKAKQEAQADQLIASSGLTAKQIQQTFASYVTEGLGADAKAAKGQAMVAANEGSWLVLAGTRGSGKSHLAVAIMLEAMKRGDGAMFRLVSEMLDELRQGNADNTYHAKMKRLKEIPCLVLDDLGKERTSGSDTGLEYLYQILDFRYRNERQTIITTNALTPKEFLSWTSANFFVPLLSRLSEMGAWCVIKDVGDYRQKTRKTGKLPLDAA
jgi:DNA replication protein DnaC